MKKQTFAVIAWTLRLGHGENADGTRPGRRRHRLRRERVQRHADVIRSAVQLDANDERALRASACRTWTWRDLHREKHRASLLAVMLVKDLGVRRIIAKAVTTLHGRILERIGVDRVIFPSARWHPRGPQPGGAQRLDYIELSRDFSIIEIRRPGTSPESSLKELALRNRYGLTLIAIKRRPEAAAPRSLTWRRPPTTRS